MSKTSRFRHRREKKEQRKLRKGVAPKPATATDVVAPLPEPIILPLSITDVIDNTNFDATLKPAESTASGSALLLKPLSKVRQQIQAWENEGGTTRIASKTRRQKQWRTGATRKDIR